MVRTILKRVINGIASSFGLLVVAKRTEQWKDPFEDQRMLIGSSNPVVILDVGAHYGESSSRYKRVFNDCQCFAFEPFPAAFATMQARFDNDQSVKMENVAIGSVVGTRKLHTNKFDATNSLLPSDCNADKVWGNGLLDTTGSLEVPVTTIDEVVSRAGLSRIDILKIDTQGSELDVLEGAKETFSKGMVSLVYVELLTLPTYEGQAEIDEIFKLLRIYGLRLYRIYDQSYAVSGELRQFDAIFISRRKYGPILRAYGREGQLP